MYGHPHTTTLDEHLFVRNVMHCCEDVWTI